MNRISDLIKKLETIKEEEGDLEMVCWAGTGMGMEIIPYNLKNMMVVNKVVKMPSKKIDIAYQWEVDSRKEALKAKRIVTNTKLLKL